MANEITAQLTFKVANGNDVNNYGESSSTIDQATQGSGSPGYVNIGTSEETLSFSEFTTLGVCKMKNLDATNYVEVGPDSSGMVAAWKLKPGEWNFVRLVPGTTYKAQANTAACKVLIIACED